MSPLRASLPSSIPTLRFTTIKSRYSSPTTISHAFHTSTSMKSSSPLFHLAALSNSRESSHFRKVSKLSQVEHSPALQLIRSSEVEPFGAPKDIKSSDEKKTSPQGKPPPLKSQALSEEKNTIRNESLPLKSQSVWSEADLAKMREMIRGGLPVSSFPEEWSKGQLAKIEELSAGEKVILRELLKRDARFESREAMMNEQANGIGKVAAQEVGRLAEIFFPSTQRDAPVGQTRVDIAEDAHTNEEADAEPWKHFGISKAEYMALQTLEEGGGSRGRKHQEKLTKSSSRPETSTNPMETPDEKLWGPEATPTSPAVSDGEWMANVMQFRKPPTEELQSSQANVRNPYPGQPLFTTNSSQKESGKTGSNTTRWVIISSILTGLLVWNVRPAGSPATRSAQPAVAAQKQSADQTKTRADEKAALADYQMQLMVLEQQNKRRLLQARLEEEKDLAARKAPIAKEKGDAKVVVSNKGWFWE